MNLSDTYRAGDVIRWQIVKTIKPQSVAEHSFQVAMIALTICDKLFLSDDGQLFKSGRNTELLLRWCLYHDLPEVFTGDVATPFKQAIKQAGVDPFSLVEGLMSEEYNKIKAEVDENPVVKHVVKLADMIESVKYLELNLCTPHGKKVQDIIKKHVADYEYPGTDGWGQPFQTWQWEMAVDNTIIQLFGEELTLDDMVNNDGTETRTKSMEESERDLNTDTRFNV